MIPSTHLNAFTVDLEDWLQGALNPNLPITSRVVRNLDRVLSLLERHNVRATFFCLGKVCQRHPELIGRVADAGHEVASHGFGHQLVYRQTPAAFCDDLRRSIDIIERQSGRRPIGYRAPAFSITPQTPWAPDVLADLGFKYSSSVFPIHGRRYGWPDAPAAPFRWSSGVIEFPLSTVRLLGRRWPMCGGGYLRLLPWPVLRRAIDCVHADRRPAVVYLHPYELDVNELVELKNAGYRFSRKVYVKQSLFRGRVAGRLHQLFSRYRFATISDVLKLNENAHKQRTAAPARAAG